MLIICYGITKSGSTLTFELIKGMLKSIGQRQKRLAPELITPPHGVNFVERFDLKLLDSLVALAPGEKYVTVKTHCDLSMPLFHRLEDLQAERKVQIVASYRDPRDIALSLLDAAAHSRARGRKEFTEFTDLASTVVPLGRQIQTFRKWGAIRGTLRMAYNTVAFSPDAAIDALERALGFTCDRPMTMRHAYEVAFTQKNKAVPDRRLTELTPEQNKEMARAFAPFINRVVRNDSDDWFVNYRRKLLTEEKKAQAA